MANQQLLGYIREQTKVGINNADIKKALLQKGWNDVDVDEAFSAVQNNGASPAPMPPPTSVAPSFQAKADNSTSVSGKQHLDPRAVWLFFFNRIYLWIVLWAYVSFQISAIVQTLSATDYKGVESTNLFGGIFFIWFFVILIILVILSYLVARLSYHFYRFELTDDGYRAERGIIWKRYVSIPYERIQNVDIYRGLLSRILGLSDLNIQTAGYSGSNSLGSEGRLPGLNVHDAEKIRDELIRRSKGVKQTF